MGRTLKLLRRFIIILLLSTFALLVFNLVLLFLSTSSQRSNNGAWTAANTVSEALNAMGSSGYTLSEKGVKILEEYRAWAILIDNDSGKVVWKSSSLPQDIPLNYSAADIATAALGYISDYPTTSSSHGKDLLILGHPKTAYWKLIYNSFDYDFIASLPKMSLLFILCNLAVIFLIYMISSTGLFRSLKPILLGIEALPENNEVHVKEKGMLSDLAASINRVSEKLSAQSRQLQKKETARANWIAGVSHDIRTPLSIVLGYAAQLEGSHKLSRSDRDKAMVIRRQGEKMKQLITDLNLASKLEYNMQPLEIKPLNAVAVSRQIAVDFMNSDIDGLHPIEWRTEESLASCLVKGDKGLLKRAMSNILQNSITHNENGCNIYITVFKTDRCCHIRMEDDGTGTTVQELERLNSAPHYMVCDESIGLQRHGLGLLLVKQILDVHGGSVLIEQSQFGGFAVELRLPK